MGEQTDMFPGYVEEPAFPPDSLCPGQMVTALGMAHVEHDGILAPQVWRIWERSPERLLLLSEHGTATMIITPEYSQSLKVVGWGGDRVPPPQHQDIGPAGWTGPGAPCSTTSPDDE